MANLSNNLSEPASSVEQHLREVASGNRFDFGSNWHRFLGVLNEDRISEAEQSLRSMLRMENLQSKCFLDIGSGSGLFSLAARRLGARVHSFDFDPKAVACTQEVKRRYFPDDPHWVVEHGSVLDQEYLHRLGTFDIVYAWGVLHHTGAMWKAIENAANCVADDGVLYISIYNDQGRMSRWWRAIKRTYCALPKSLRWVILWPCLIRLWMPATIRDLLCGRPGATWRNYWKKRGMSPWHDVVDWVGGFPFEVAKPEQVFHALVCRGFVLNDLVTCAGKHGCNEYLFQLVRSQK